jgi:hypothetical protein
MRFAFSRFRVVTPAAQRTRCLAAQRTRCSAAQRIPRAIEHALLAP